MGTKPCTQGSKAFKGAPSAKPRPCSGEQSARGHGQDAETWPQCGWRKRAHLGARRQHAVLTTNVGGSSEAWILAMETEADVLLVQEHRIAGPGLVSAMQRTQRRHSGASLATSAGHERRPDGLGHRSGDQVDALAGQHPRSEYGDIPARGSALDVAPRQIRLCSATVLGQVSFRRPECLRFGRTRAEISPTSVEIGTDLADAGPTSAEVCPISGSIRPMLVDSGPHWADSGRTLSIIGRSPAKFGRIRGSLDRHRSRVVELGRNRANFGPGFRRNWLASVELTPRLRRGRCKLGPSRASLAHFRPKIDRISWVCLGGPLS